MKGVKLPITAIVAGYNEAGYLTDCLQSIAFCEHIYYYDLGSTDNSMEMARKAGATKLIPYHKVPCIEALHAVECSKAPTDWILFMDPDEVVAPPLSDDLVAWFGANSHSSEMASCDVPIQFYFAGKALHGTPWGGIKWRKLLAHKHRFEFSDILHGGREIKHGFTGSYIPYRKTNILHHYWTKDWQSLKQKHDRYLRKEGEARFSLGERMHFLTLLKEPFRSFYEAYIKTRGVKNGILGLRLSLFWSWYQTRASLALYRYQQQHPTT